MQVDELQAELQGFQKEITAFLSGLRLPRRQGQQQSIGGRKGNAVGGSAMKGDRQKSPALASPMNAQGALDRTGQTNRSKSKEGGKKSKQIDELSMGGAVLKPHIIFQSDLQTNNGFAFNQGGMTQIEAESSDQQRQQNQSQKDDNLGGSRAGQGSYLEKFEKKIRKTQTDLQSQFKDPITDLTTPIQVEAMKRNSINEQNKAFFGEMSPLENTVGSGKKMSIAGVQKASFDKRESDLLGKGKTRDSKIKNDSRLVESEVHIGGTRDKQFSRGQETKPSAFESAQNVGKRYSKEPVEKRDSEAGGPPEFNSAPYRELGYDYTPPQEMIEDMYRRKSSLKRGSVANKYDDFERPDEIKNRHSHGSPDSHLKKEQMQQMLTREAEVIRRQTSAERRSTLQVAQGSNLSKGPGSQILNSEGAQPKRSSVDKKKASVAPPPELSAQPLSEESDSPPSPKDNIEVKDLALDTRFSNLNYTAPRLSKFDAQLGQQNRINGIFLTETNDEIFLSTDTNLILYDIADPSAQKVVAQISLKNFDVIS